MLKDCDVDFALGVVDILQRLVKTLITRYQNRGPGLFCTILSGDLVEIRNWLEDNRKHVDESHFSEVLTLLESLCKDTKSTSKSTPCTGQKTHLPENYPELTKLASKGWHKDARSSLEKLSSDLGTPKDKSLRLQKQRRVQKRFENILSKITATEAAGVVEPKVTKKDEDDFSAHLSTLHAVLSRYNTCQDTSADIIPKFSLSGYQRHDTSGSTFNMLFPDHPHQTGGKPCNWQNAVVHVGPEVAFADKDAEQVAGMGIDYHEFCGAISGRQQEKLFLTVSKKDCKLHQAMRPDPIGGNAWMLTAPDSPGLSLRKILAGGELLSSSSAHVKVKIILFYLLAKGVWQFYDSELMPDQWTKDTVEFLFEYRERNGTLTAGLFLNQPLISADLHPPTDQKGLTVSLSHKFPKIRELGIMLLEILLGSEIDSFRGEPEAAPFLPGGKVTPYTDHSIANWLFKKQVQKDTLIFKPVKDVIGRCLDDQSFRPFLTAKMNDKLGPGRLREAMYDQLVHPLKSLLDVMYDDPYDLNPLHELSTLPAVKYSGAVSPSQRQHHGPGYFGSQTAATRAMETPVEISPDEEPSKRWFEEMEKVQEILQPGWGEEDSTRNSKIAVIDTGFSQRHGVSYDISPGNYKDFVDGQDDQQRDDSQTGHGTTLVRLILEITDKVDLYVARVYEKEGVYQDECVGKDKDLANKSFGLVEQAIGWAVDKDVDIILMASGTSKVYDDVRKAINTLPDKVLFIAAAGNRIDCDRVAFPARMPRVMCTFATTARNNISRHLNPSPLERAYNFGIFGENVQPDTWDTAVSGTSFAAAIAAGFTASLLYFSRLPVPAGERTLNLEGYEKMNFIFEELSRDNKDHEYNCIVPWRLMSLVTFNNNPDRLEQLRQHRQRIRNFLSDILLQRM